MNNILSIDAETNGLWGRPFAIAAVLYVDCVETKTFTARTPDSNVTDTWVKDNVLPTLGDVPVTHETYEEMMAAFASFYTSHKGATALWHMGHVVEAFLFRELVRLELIGSWDAPYTPVEVSETLRANGFDPSSVDSYAKENGIKMPDGSTHNPLYDCRVAASVFFDLA